MGLLGLTDTGLLLELGEPGLDSRKVGFGDIDATATATEG
jgi:hypothetical protein